jgi:hypothetical protein
MTPSGQIHLYGVVQAFRQGRMPDNKQINETLQYFLNHSIVDTSKLSSEGKRLVNVLCRTSILSCLIAFPFPVPASM